MSIVSQVGTWEHQLNQALNEVKQNKHPETLTFLNRVRLLDSNTKRS